MKVNEMLLDNFNGFEHLQVHQTWKQNQNINVDHCLGN